MPGDPVYGELKVSGGAKAFPDNNTKSLLGLAAKGNIIIGDYNSLPFQSNVKPLIQSKANNVKSKTQPYVVDDTDKNLGYDSGNPSACGNKSPCFNGDYTQQDRQNGVLASTADNVPRTFVMSNFRGKDFTQALKDAGMPSAGLPMTIDAVLYTNHALAGFVPGSLTINGAMVARDDGLIRNGALTINHDIRLLGVNTAQQVVLPLSLRRPTLSAWRECTPTDPCP